ncbi:unnamed protein product, partial [Phaeothamnion confervicola]
SANADLHWGDYENLHWDRIVAGGLRANSFCIRKGLSRKAQLSLYIRKFLSKNPASPLKHAVPRTLIVDTWEAFDEKLSFNLSGDIACFGEDLGVRQCLRLADRIDWCLADARDWMAALATAAGGGAALAPKDAPEVESAASAASVAGAGGSSPGPWILKPSTLNKAAGVAIVRDFEELRQAINGCTDVREWVLQEYIRCPLLLRRRKFHIRVYVLAGKS